MRIEGGDSSYDLDLVYYNVRACSSQLIAKEIRSFLRFFYILSGLFNPIFTAFRITIYHVAHKSAVERETDHMVNDVTIIGLVILLFAAFWGFVQFCEKA